MQGQPVSILTDIVRNNAKPPVRSAGTLVEPALRAGIAPREPAGTFPKIKSRTLDLYITHHQGVNGNYGFFELHFPFPVIKTLSVPHVHNIILFCKCSKISCVFLRRRTLHTWRFMPNRDALQEPCSQ